MFLALKFVKIFALSVCQIISGSSLRSRPGAPATNPPQKAPGSRRSGSSSGPASPPGEPVIPRHRCRRRRLPRAIPSVHGRSRPTAGARPERGPGPASARPGRRETHRIGASHRKCRGPLVVERGGKGSTAEWGPPSHALRLLGGQPPPQWRSRAHPPLQWRSRARPPLRGPSRRPRPRPGSPRRTSRTPASAPASSRCRTPSPSRGGPAGCS